jgi:hypothetical protein
VDAAVLDVVEGILASPQARAALAVKPKADPGAAARLKELTDRLEAVETEIVDGKMPPETGARITTRLAGQIAAAESAAAPVFSDPAVRRVAASRLGCAGRLGATDRRGQRRNPRLPAARTGLARSVRRQRRRAGAGGLRYVASRDRH